MSTVETPSASTMTSRSSADATRFTATQPHAYSQSNQIPSSAASPLPPDATTSPPQPTPSSSSSNSPPNSNGSPSQTIPETPKEKLARLRAARIAQRQIKLTTWERIVIRGRVWADTIHKATTTGLALTGLVMLGVGGFVMADMILHNRRKRNAFRQAQHDIYQARLLTAVETQKAGLPLEEHQVLILARERWLLKAEEMKKKQTWADSLRIMITKKIEDLDPVVVPSEREMLRKMGVDNSYVLDSMGKAGLSTKGDFEIREETELTRAVRRKREEMGLEEKSEPSEPAEPFIAASKEEGGMLDRLGEQSLRDAKATTSNFSPWLSWGK